MQVTISAKWRAYPLFEYGVSLPRIALLSLFLAVSSFAHAEPPSYEDAFGLEVMSFASHNRLRSGLHREVHADCYIPLTVATTIAGDGSVRDISIVESSSVPIVDRYFRWVIEQAAPYPPLAGYYDHVPDEVTITREFRLDVRLWSDGVRSTRECDKLPSS